MNTSISTAASGIDAREVPDDERRQTLPRHFGRDMLRVERAVFTFMGSLSRDYTAAFWRFFELSNGGFYMAPGADCTFRVIVEGTGFDGEMSADAAGITACLFAYSHLSFHTSNEAVARHYHQLRDFALRHSEARKILAAID